MSLGTDPTGEKILEYAAKAGAYEIAMTCPLREAGQPVQLRIYVRHAGSGRAYQGALWLRLRSHSAIQGDRDVAAPRKIAGRGGLYRPLIQFPAEGSYLAELTIGEGATKEERAVFSIVIGNRGRPAAVLGSVGVGLALIVGIIVTAKRIKRRA